jgi:guanylate kinase
MLLSDARQGQFLEVARIRHRCPRRGTTDSYWYGTSLATVREVAATGKLCVASLDLQGVMVRGEGEREGGAECV